MADLEPYNRIPCRVYDQFELLAMRRMPVQIKYRDADLNHFQLNDVIVNLKSIKKVEYAIMKSGVAIRLDWIIQLNDLIIQNQTGCYL